MKKVFPVVLLQLFLFVFPGLAQTPSLSPLEQNIIDEINRVRTNPASYAKWIEENRKNLPYKPQKEKVVDETIKVLNSTSALPALTILPGINAAAKDHLDNQLPTGYFSHKGTDGSTVDKRLKRHGQLEGGSAENAAFMGSDDAKGFVLSWIIDDVISGRDHRKNILNKNYLFTGIACGQYPSSTKLAGLTLCVMPFAVKFQ